MSEKAVASAIEEMVEFFLPYCEETSTLVELKEVAGNQRLWRSGHDLFSRIRTKTLQADAAENRFLQDQYSFEEICAKTLFNLSDCKGPPYPFDEYSPFWVIPIAVGFARTVGAVNPYAVTQLLQPSSGEAR